MKNLFSKRLIGWSWTLLFFYQNGLSIETQRPTRGLETEAIFMVQVGSQESPRFNCVRKDHGSNHSSQKEEDEEKKSFEMNREYYADLVQKCIEKDRASSYDEDDFERKRFSVELNGSQGPICSYTPYHYYDQNPETKEFERKVNTNNS